MRLTNLNTMIGCSPEPHSETFHICELRTHMASGEKMNQSPLTRQSRNPNSNLHGMTLEVS